MTNQRKHTVELTLDQMEDLFAFINSAGVLHHERAAELGKFVGTYDMSISTVDRMHGHELLANKARDRWIEFYQIIKVARRAEKGGEA